MKKNKNHGFTLIELLIVVAIIAILAAIAIPNFLAAQIRSKVSRTKNDLRSVAVGIESYHVDYNDYPKVTGGAAGALHALPIDITTPISYLSSIPKDPFGISAGYDIYKVFGTTEDYYYATKAHFDFYGYPWRVFPGGNTSNPALWNLMSKGPDLAWAQIEFPAAWEVDEPYTWAYDPTNGTVSRGNIPRSGP